MPSRRKSRPPGPPWPSSHSKVCGGYLAPRGTRRTNITPQADRRPLTERWVSSATRYWFIRYRITAVASGTFSSIGPWPSWRGYGPSKHDRRWLELPCGLRGRSHHGFRTVQSKETSREEAAMTTARILSLFAVALFCAHSTAARASDPITEEAAHAIGVDAYVYFYPLLSMDLTRKQFTNIEPGKEFGKGPMNIFVNVPEYPPADFKGVVRSNFDTLYSIAWLDLTKEPLVVSAPDTDGRFYLLPMLDMWTDVFASLGWRTTGTEAGNFLVTAPGWVGTVPEGFTRLAAPTSYIWI